MLPYRFEFETDEQYEARTGVSAEQAPGEDAPPATNTVVENRLPDSERSAPVYVFPWWTVVIAGLVLIIAFYESYRRKLTRAIRDQAAQLDQANVSPPPSPLSDNLPVESSPITDTSLQSVQSAEDVNRLPEGWSEREILPTAPAEPLAVNAVPRPDSVDESGDDHPAPSEVRSPALKKPPRRAPRMNRRSARRRASVALAGVKLGRKRGDPAAAGP